MLKYEKDYLNSIGRKDLANKVKHVSVEDGDGAGYDILSFDADGNEKYIEVKTTQKGPDEPFYLTDNELEFSKTVGDKYYIYRVYELKASNTTAKFYSVSGDLFDKLVLKPTTYYVAGIKE